MLPGLAENERANLRSEAPSHTEDACRAWDAESHPPQKQRHTSSHPPAPSFGLSLSNIPFKRSGRQHHVPHDLSSVLVHSDSPMQKNASQPGVRGNPGPFGLLCFGMTTVMIMFIHSGWTDKAFMPTVFCYAAFYGGLGQFVAGILELIRGSTFAGTAFSSYGCFWMGWFLLEYLMTSDPTLFTLSRTGKTLWCGLWSLLTFGFFIITLRKNLGLITVFSTLTVTFALLGGGLHSSSCDQAAGYIGLVCGASAIYTAFAELYQEEMGITLPGVRPVRYL